MTTCPLAFETLNKKLEEEKTIDSIAKHFECDRRKIIRLIIQSKGKAYLKEHATILDYQYQEKLPKKYIPFKNYKDFKIPQPVKNLTPLDENIVSENEILQIKCLEYKAVLKNKIHKLLYEYFEMGLSLDDILKILEELKSSNFINTNSSKKFIKTINDEKQIKF